jgi:hypothetical protein
MPTLEFVANYRDTSDGAVSFGPNADLSQLLVLHDGDQLTVVDYPSFTEHSTDTTHLGASGLINVNPLGIAPYLGDDWIWWAELDEAPTVNEFAVFAMIPGAGPPDTAYGATASTTSGTPTWNAVLDLPNNTVIVLHASTFSMELEVEVIDLDTYAVLSSYGPYDITGLFLKMAGSRGTLTPDGAVWFITGAFPHGIGRWHPTDGVSVVTSGLTDGVRGSSQGLLPRPDGSVWAVMANGSDQGIRVSPSMVVSSQPALDPPFTGVLSAVSDATAQRVIVNPFYIQYGEFWEIGRGPWTVGRVAWGSWDSWH